MNEDDHYADYLGDGVYASFDGYQIWLTTQEGQRIALEPEVFGSLLRYEKRLHELMKVQS